MLRESYSSASKLLNPITSNKLYVGFKKAGISNKMIFKEKHTGKWTWDMMMARYLEVKVKRTLDQPTKLNVYGDPVRPPRKNSSGLIPDLLAQFSTSPN